jgi:hypothetical protein
LLGAGIIRTASTLMIMEILDDAWVDVLDPYRSTRFSP